MTCHDNADSFRNERTVWDWMGWNGLQWAIKSLGRYFFLLFSFLNRTRLLWTMNGWMDGTGLMDLLSVASGALLLPYSFIWLFLGGYLPTFLVS